MQPRSHSGYLWPFFGMVKIIGWLVMEKKTPYKDFVFHPPEFAPEFAQKCSLISSVKSCWFWIIVQENCGTKYWWLLSVIVRQKTCPYTGEIWGQFIVIIGTILCTILYKYVRKSCRQNPVSFLSYNCRQKCLVLCKLEMACTILPFPYKIDNPFLSYNCGQKSSILCMAISIHNAVQ